MPSKRPLLSSTPFQRVFPLEIFLVIKATIPLGDIRTHVCFYKTHSRITAMYDSEKNDDLFWRRVCWHSGIGALDKDDLEDPHCWRGIALELVEKDGFCKHPRCGEGLLKYNSKSRTAPVAKCVVSPCRSTHGRRSELAQAPHRVLRLERRLVHRLGLGF